MRFFGYFSLVILLLSACNGRSQSYTQPFDDAEDWTVGDDTYSASAVENGVYDLLITSDSIGRWAAANETFSDGIYSVEATLVDGPLDNGYGFLFRADAESGDFYLFKISGDGYVWMGRYRDGVEEEAIVGGHWVESTAVNQGQNVTNTLQVTAESGNLIFSVNDQEVGRVTDNTFDSGDIGLFAETLGQSGVHVQFDNFSIEPIQ